MGIAKIVTAASGRDENGLLKTQGTEVFVDGKKLEGVTKITLVAEMNSVWKATIECHARFGEIDGVLDVTDLSDSEFCRYEKAG
jgi:hypothetical protein